MAITNFESLGVFFAGQGDMLLFDPRRLLLMRH